MIKNKADLKEYLMADLDANIVPKNAIKRYLYALHGNEQCNAFKYIRLLRYTEYYLNTKRIFMYHLCRWRLSRLGLKLFIRVSLNTTGKGLCIIHIAGGGGNYLNAKSIGENCSVQSGVVIGGKELAENKPIVGNNVSFGLGCKVYGNICIGDNAYILPNAVVTHDVPTNAIVGGVPAKLIKYRDANSVK